MENQDCYYEHTDIISFYLIVKEGMWIVLIQKNSATIIFWRDTYKHEILMSSSIILSSNPMR